MIAASRACLGLGSNLGDPVAQVSRALDVIAREEGIELVAVSSLYRTAPVGDPDQEDFVNAVCVVNTTLSPDRLLATLKRLENEAGRQRDPRRPFGPRLLDLDLLLYGDSQREDAVLRIPHPRMHERRFVLEPLVEVDPLIRIPGRGPAAELLAGCAGQRVERLEAPLAVRPLPA
jgi:2-amino-4-hydroxy-6-hydroxymethyldihydropteridine diphosphokinase